jgi:quinoprotein glucose dehydrogenase
MFVPTRNSVMVASLTKADPALTNWNFIRAPTESIRGPRGLPINRPPWSLITATDMNRGEHVWSRSIGGAPDWIRNHPSLKGLKLDFDNMGQPGARPGPLATKTLLFLAEAGNLSGDPGGPLFRAYDKQTGAVIAEITLPSKASGAPMTYMHQGRQYIVIAVSTSAHPAELVALTLPRSETASIRGGVQRARSSGSNSSTSESGAAFGIAPTRRAVMQEGRAIYARSCSSCHGSNGEGIAGSTSPLTGLKDLNQIRRVVANGSVKMPAMQTMLTKSQIELVSRFIIEGMNRK